MGTLKGYSFMSFATPPPPPPPPPKKKKKEKVVTQWHCMDKVVTWNTFEIRNTNLIVTYEFTWYIVGILPSIPKLPHCHRYRWELDFGGNELISGHNGSLWYIKEYPILRYSERVPMVAHIKQISWKQRDSREKSLWSIYLNTLLL